MVKTHKNITVRVETHAKLSQLAKEQGSSIETILKTLFLPRPTRNWNHGFLDHLLDILDHPKGKGRN